MRHLALLGDSILDNISYTWPQPDTATHLRRGLGPDWSVELLARDGSTMADIPFQLSALRANTDVGVLSVGGNDAVNHMYVLERRRTSNLEVLAQLLAIADDFAGHYRRTIIDTRMRVGRLLVCTIYEPPLLDPTAAALARVPLSLLNDRIIGAAAVEGVDVIDLRFVCTEAADFVQEIEPSPTGAAKIARAIARSVLLNAGDGGIRYFAT